MTRVLPREEIRRWVISNFTRGDAPEKMLADRELPMAAFCRTVGISTANLTRFKNGRNDVLGARPLRLMSRFIIDWENGLLEFGGTRQRGRTLIHRSKPKPRPPRMTLAITASGPRLQFLQRRVSETPIFLTVKAK